MALFVCTNETHSVGELTCRQEVHHTVASDAGNDRGRDPDLEKDKLAYVGEEAVAGRRGTGGSGASRSHAEMKCVVKPPEHALFCVPRCARLEREQLGDVAVRERGG